MEPLINGILYFVFFFWSTVSYTGYCIGFIYRGCITNNLEGESIISND